MNKISVCKMWWENMVGDLYSINKSRLQLHFICLRDSKLR